MSDTIKIGQFDVTSFKVGSSDCKIYLGDTLLYPQTPKDYFRFVAKESGTFSFIAKDTQTANTLNYSLDSGKTWISLSHLSSTPTLNQNDVIMWKADNLTIGSNGCVTFTSTGQFDVEGNIMSLHYGDNFENQTDLTGKDYAFMNLFSGCTTVINSSGMTLPATTLSPYCYCNLFIRAYNLITAPQQLPAMTLTNSCYFNMFYTCSGMTSTPELPATTLVTDCYKQMFRNCTNLNKIVCLATNISASNCTTNWVYGVAASGTFYKASEMSSWTTGVNGIPTSWTKRDYNPYEFKHLTFTALESGTFKFSVNNINYSIDSGKTWNTLSANTNSPTLESGDTIMWKASGLTPTSGDGIGRFSSTCNFAAEGNIMSLHYGDNFEGERSLSGKDYAFRAIFYQMSGLTSIDNLVMPATTLSRQCYRNMFGNTSITSVPTDLLPATSLGIACYMNMFIGCRSLTDVSNLKLPSTTLANTCYQGMFAQCANLERTPTLSAATLVKECYIYMYQTSPKINYIKCLATNISASNCTTNWVTGVAASGTFVKASSMSSWTTGTSGIPSGWTITNA